jgi:hypothetical protein
MAGMGRAPRLNRGVDDESTTKIFLVVQISSGRGSEMRILLGAAGMKRVEAQ